MSRKIVFSKLLLGTTFAFLLTNQIHAASFLENVELKNGGLAVTLAQETETSLSGNFLAAQTASNDNNAKEAVSFYEKAIVQDPDNIILKQALFNALVSNGQIERSLETLNDIAVEEQTQSLNFAVSAADALKKKSWARAQKLIENLEGTDLDSMNARLFFAWALVGERKVDEAIAKAETVDGPEWTKVIKDYHIGTMLSSVGRDKEAIAYFEKAIVSKAIAGPLTETFIRAVEGLARARARTDDVAGAKLAIVDGLRLIPRHAPLTQLLSEIDNETPIMPLINSATNGASEIFFNVGSAISRQGGLPFAQSHLQIAHYLAPESDVVLLSLGNVYEGQKDYERANEYYRLVSDKSPNWRRAQLEIGLNLNQMDKTDEAIEALKAIVAQEPLELVGVSALGRVYAQREKYLEAAALYDATLPNLDPIENSHWGLFYRRGIAFERTKQWNKAEADFKKALELSPNQADVLNYLGYSWVDMGINLDEGLDMIRKAVELRPNSGFIIDSLGWAYYRLERYEEAAVELERALELMPTDPTLNDHLGDAYWQIGRKLEATFLWRHALGNKPNEENKALIEKKLLEGLTN
ncbi:MAG: tetratricopeptide repeat protein [Nitratireductor sp.]